MNKQGKSERAGWEAAVRPTPRAVYRALFENADLAFYVIAVLPDGSFRIEDANAAAAPFQLRPDEKVVGCAPAECLIPDIAACLEENLRHCAETGKVYSYDRTMGLPQGQTSWTTTLTPILNRERRVSHIVGITRDITLERRLLSAVGQRTSMMDGIDATSPGLIYLFDVKGRCSRYVGGTNTLGYDNDELIRMGSRIVSDHIHPDDLPNIGRHLETLAQLRDGEVATVEYRMLHKDGHYVDCLSRDTVFSRSPSGEVELILGIKIDISERKEMEQEVRLLAEQLVTSRSDERKRIAQDLHDSTGQHLVAAELALLRVQAANAKGTSATMDEALTDVLSEIKEAEREIRVISFLLHPPSIEAQGLAGATRSLAMGFGNRANIDVQAEIDPDVDDLPEPLAISLFRICQEALTNVHRHARASEVRVSLQARPDQVTLTVVDDGIGFDEARSSLSGGYGVGLVGMRARVETLGGAFEIDSEGGARVVATVPLDGANRLGPTPRPA
jgi:PAS domain S-box-containing protein